VQQVGDNEGRGVCDRPLARPARIVSFVAMRSLRAPFSSALRLLSACVLLSAATVTRAATDGAVAVRALAAAADARATATRAQPAAAPRARAHRSLARPLLPLLRAPASETRLYLAHCSLLR
jgi:hypothetical protein